jgi:hypothetical protein
LPAGKSNTPHVCLALSLNAALDATISILQVRDVTPVLNLTISPTKPVSPILHPFSVPCHFSRPEKKSFSYARGYLHADARVKYMPEFISDRTNDHTHSQYYCGCGRLTIESWVTADMFCSFCIPYHKVVSIVLPTVHSSVLFSTYYTFCVVNTSLYHLFLLCLDVMDV